MPVIAPLSSGGNQSNSNPYAGSGSSGVIQPLSSGQARQSFNPPPTQPAAPAKPTNVFQSIEQGAAGLVGGAIKGIGAVDNAVSQGVTFFNNLPGVKQAEGYAKQAFSTVVNAHINGGQSIAQQFNDTLQNFSPIGQKAYAPANEGQPESLSQLSARSATQEAQTTKKLQSNQWYVDLNRDSAIAMTSLINGATVNKPLPQDLQPKNLQEKIVYGVANALGNIYTIGKLQHVFASLAYGNGTVQKILEAYPKLSFLPGFLSQIAGLDIRSQLDPTVKNKFSQFLQDSALGAIQQGTGSIPNIGRMPAFVLSAPVNFGLFYGLAKLHGASDQDALIAGGIGAGLDIGGRLHQAAFAARMQNGTLEMTPDEVLQNVPGGNVENTPLGKDLIRAAMEARGNGQNVVLDLNVTKESPAAEFLGQTYRGVGYNIHLTDPTVVAEEGKPSLIDQIKDLPFNEKGGITLGENQGEKSLTQLDFQAAKDAYLHGNPQAENAMQSAGERMHGETAIANFEDAYHAGDYTLARQIAQESGQQTLLDMAGRLPDQAPSRSNPEAGGIDFFAKIEMPAIGKEITGFLSQIPDSAVNKDEGGLIERPQIVSGTIDETVTQEQVAKALQGTPPLTVELGNTFVVKTSPTNEQLRVDVVSPALRIIQQQLGISQTPENQPSIPVANLLPGTAEQFASSTALQGIPITLPQLTFTTPSGKQITVPLASTPSSSVVNQPATQTPSTITLPTVPAQGLTPGQSPSVTDANPFVQSPGKGAASPSFSVPLHKNDNETGLIKEAIKTGHRQEAIKLYNGYRVKGRYTPLFSEINSDAVREARITNQRLIGIQSFVRSVSHAPSVLLETAKTLQRHYEPKPLSLMEASAKRGEVTHLFPHSDELVTKLLSAADFSSFTHEVFHLSKTYGGAFSDIYAKIQSGVITKHEYHQFKTYYQSIQTESLNTQGFPAGNKSEAITNNQASGKSIQPSENRQPVQGSTHPEQESENPKRSNAPVSNHQAAEVRQTTNNRPEPAFSESTRPATSERGRSGAERSLTNSSESRNTRRDEFIKGQIAKAKEDIEIATQRRDAAPEDLTEEQILRGDASKHYWNKYIADTKRWIDKKEAQLSQPTQETTPVSKREYAQPVVENAPEEHEKEFKSFAPVVDKFVNEDLIPRAGDITPWFQAANHEIRAFMFPASLADTKALNLIFTYKGDNDLFKFINRGTYKQYSLLGKQVNIIKYWDRYSKADHQRFYDNFENPNNSQPNPAWKALDTMYRQRYDAIYDKLSQYKEINKIDNYFRRMWDLSGKSEKDFNTYHATFKKSLQGDLSWTKQRFYRFYMDAVKKGLVAKETNPEIVTEIAEENAARFEHAQQLWQDAKLAGKLTFVRVGGDMPPGMAKINDRIAKVYLPPEIPIKESFDQTVWDKLNQFAASLGIEHERKVGIGRRAGGELGYTKEGEDKVVTKFASPSSVLAHELGHQLDFTYHLQDQFMRNQTMSRELSDLAKKRYEGYEDHVSPSYEKYIQKGSEKMAVMLESFIHAPEIFKEAAPTVYHEFTQFLSSHSELRPLLAIKPSLVLGSRIAKVSAGGAVIGGDWVGEENFVRLINNHLSSDKISNSVIGRMLQTQKALMNGIQLSMSGFHPQFLGIDAIANKLNIAERQLVKGDFKNLPRTIGSTPVGLLEYYIKGNNVIKKAFAKDPEALAALKIAARAGSHIVQPEAFQASVLENFIKNMKQGNYIGALFRSPYAAIEGFYRPLFGNLVPKAKLGVFMENYGQALIDHRVDLTTGKTDELTLARQIWRDVEDRMGELNYDNQFWNNTFKGAVQIMMRAPGWFKGTIATLGGGVKDDAKLLTDLSRYVIKKGDKPVFTQRGQYIFNLLFVVMALGALYQYLHTGKKPQELKDYFMPKNGALDSNGNDMRVIFATYFKDAISIINNPYLYVMNKSAPEVNLLFEELQNRDFFGNQFRDNDVPKTTKDLLQSLQFALKTGLTPFTYQQSQQQTTPLSKLESIAGILKAPAQFIQSDKQKAAAATYEKIHGLPGPQSPQQQQIAQLKSQARSEINKSGVNNSPAFQQLVKMGVLNTPLKRSNFIKSAKLTGTQRLIKTLPKATRKQINAISQ